MGVDPLVFTSGGQDTPNPPSATPLLPKLEELCRIRDARLEDRQSAKRDTTFNSHGHGDEGAKREAVVRMSIGNPFDHV